MPTVISGSGITLPGDAVSPLQAVTRQQILTLMPAGVVLPFATPTVPAGWLKCKGQAISRTLYADLFSAIGTTYGAGDGSSTFNVPNLQGEFFRGLDEDRGVDPGRSIGNSQDAKVGGFTWRVRSDDGDSSVATYKSITGLEIGGQWEDVGNWGGNQTGGLHTVEVTPWDTRPRNVALLFCIKT